MKNSLSIANALGYDLVDKRIEILRLIDKRGSISQAAREADVSYKAAWQAIDTLTNLAGVNLVDKAVGGAGGGGACLTKAGLQLLTTADLMDKVRQEVLSQLRSGSDDVFSSTLSQLAIRTSMRNHLPCRVLDLEYRGQIVRAHLQLPGGETIVSRITLASAELLSLESGQPVVALFKATAVEVGRDLDTRETPGRNLLTGRAARVLRDENDVEVSVELSAGLQIVGFASASQGIKTRNKVFAAFDESAVVVALA